MILFPRFFVAVNVSFIHGQTLHATHGRLDDEENEKKKRAGGDLQLRRGRLVVLDDD